MRTIVRFSAPAAHFLAWPMIFCLAVFLFVPAADEVRAAGKEMRLVVSGTYAHAAKAGIARLSISGKFLLTVVDESLVLYDTQSMKELWRKSDYNFYDAVFHQNSIIALSQDDDTGSTRIHFYLISGILIKMYDKLNNTEFFAFDYFRKHVIFQDDKGYLYINAGFILENYKKINTIDMKNNQAWVKDNKIKEFGNLFGIENYRNSKDNDAIMTSFSRRWNIYVQKDATLRIENRAVGKSYLLQYPDNKYIKISEIRQSKMASSGDNTSSYHRSILFSEYEKSLSIVLSNNNILFFSLKDNPKFAGELKSGDWPVNTSDLLQLTDDKEKTVAIFRVKDTLKRPAGMASATINFATNKCEDIKNFAESDTSDAVDLIFDKNNLAYIAFTNGQINRLDMSTGKITQITPKSIYTWSSMVYSRGDNAIYLGTEDGKICRLSEKNLLEVIVKVQNPVKRLAVDSEAERLWFLAGSEKEQDEGGQYTLNLFFLKKKFLVTHKQILNSSLQYIPMFFNEKTNELMLFSMYGQFQIKLTGKWTEGYTAFFDTLWLPQTFSNNLQMSVGSFQDGFDPVFHYAFYNPYNSHIDSDKIVSDNIIGFFGAACFFDDSGNLFATIGGQKKIVTDVTTDYKSQQEGEFRIYRLDKNNPAVNSKKLGDYSNSDFRALPYFTGAFVNNAKNVLTLTRTGLLTFWDVRTGKPLLNWLFFKNDNWLVMDEQNRFDSSDIDAIEGLHWIHKDRPLTPVPFDAFMRDYYQPGLAEYIIKGNPLPKVPDLSTRNTFQHQISIRDIRRTSPDRVEVEADIHGLSSKQPIEDIKLFRNRQLVAVNTGKLLRPDASGKATVIFKDIPLPQKESAVAFKVYGFNADRVRSSVAQKQYTYVPVQTDAQSRLTLVNIGVNEFDNPAWNLKYAVNDARSLSYALNKAFAPYMHMRTFRLTTDKADIAPTKANIEAMLKALAKPLPGAPAPKKPLRVEPDDTLIISIASHGLTVDNEFYILPKDIASGPSDSPEFLGKAISMRELGGWLRNVQAREIVLVLDTCQSGASVGGSGFKPGPMGDRGFGQLVYDKGMRVICATNENAAALEDGGLRHGLLSYALLAVLDDFNSGRKKSFSTKSWLTEARDQTIPLYEAAREGESVKTLRGAVLVGDKLEQKKDVDAVGQEPRLFDYGVKTLTVNAKK